jgi:hypothetical protein
MRKLIVPLLLLPALMAGSHASAQPNNAPTAKPATPPGKPAAKGDPTPAETDNPPVEDDTDVREAREARRSLEGLTAKLKPTLTADRRTKALLTEIAAIAQLPDPVARKEKLKALQPRIEAVRSDAFRKAELDRRAVAQKLTAVRLAKPPLRSTEVALPAGSVISTVTTSSFPVFYTHKNTCPDAADRWSFVGDKVKVVASSGIWDNDCMRIAAGRAATVQVPPGTKKMKVIMKAKVTLDVTAVALGVYASATARLGIRVLSPSGAKLAEVSVGKVTHPSPLMMNTTAFLHEKEEALASKYGGLSASFSKDLQEGDPESSSTFDFKYGHPGPTLQIAPYVGGSVDADVQGYASVDASVTPKSLKVIFYR